MRRINLSSTNIKPIYILNENKDTIFKSTDLEIVGVPELSNRYTFEAVATHDYINPDESDRQGWVEIEDDNYTIDDIDITVFPIDETIQKVVEGEDCTIIKSEELPKFFKAFTPLNEIEEYFAPL